MKSERLAALKRLALAATGGTNRRYWKCKGDGWNSLGDYVQIASGQAHVARIGISSIREADCHFIVAADPATVLDLISMAEEAKSEKSNWLPLTKEIEKSLDAVDIWCAWGRVPNCVFRKDEFGNGPTWCYVSGYGYDGEQWTAVNGATHYMPVPKGPNGEESKF